METVIFYVLAVITLISAMFVVFLRRPVHNVLSMIVTMCSLACLYFLLHAEFVGMVQLVVYAGAVMVLFLFVIMLLNLEALDRTQDAKSARMWVGALLGLGLLVMIGPVLKAFFPSGKPVGAAAFAQGMSNIEIVARELFTTYLLPFEITSVLLLAAIIGTVIVSRKRTD
ncbi:MAG: NADH-quinone oxidoreductase subunit J [Pseudomonadota bacterium]